MRASFPIFIGCLCLFAWAAAAEHEEFISAGQMGGLDNAANDAATAVAADNSGNIYIVGDFGATADLDPGPGVYLLTPGDAFGDIYVVKVDRHGHLVRVGTMGSVGGSDYARGAVLDPAGNLLVVGDFGGPTFDADPGPGTFTLSSLTDPQAFLSKLDDADHLVWALRPARTTSISDFSYGRQVAVDASAHVYVSGSFRGTVDVDPGPGIFNLSAASDSTYVSKLDSAGQFVWARQIGGATGTANIANLLVNAAGDVYMTGWFFGTVDFDPGPGTFPMTAVGSDGFIAKWSAAGNFIWAVHLGGDNDDLVAGGALDGSGNLYVTGHFEGTVDFDPGPGTFLMTTPGLSDQDAFVAEYSSAGQLLWAAQMGGKGSQYGITLSRDSDGGVVTTGFCTSVVDFLPGPGRRYLQGAGNYIWKLDAGGSFVSIEILGNTSVLGSTVSARGDLYLVGLFSGTADIDPGPGTYSLTALGRTDAFISRFGRSCPVTSQVAPYGQLLFPAYCAHDAAFLSTDVYATTQTVLQRGSRDRFFLASTGGVPAGDVMGPVFTPLVADDRIHVNGIDPGPGPHSYQPGVPPVLLYTPIDSDLVPLAGPALGTSIVPTGVSAVQVDLLDTDRAIYGHTALYLVSDCGIWPAGNSPTTLNWISHDPEVAGTHPEFDVRYGLLSELMADRNFSRATCLGHFFDTPGMDSAPNPPMDDGYYYMGRGLDNCIPQGYGESSLVPDPRDALSALAACP